MLGGGTSESLSASHSPPLRTETGLEKLGLALPTSQASPTCSTAYQRALATARVQQGKSRYQFVSSLLGYRLVPTTA